MNSILNWVHIHFFLSFVQQKHWGDKGEGKHLTSQWWVLAKMVSGNEQQDIKSTRICLGKTPFTLSLPRAQMSGLPSCFPPVYKFPKGHLFFISQCLPHHLKGTQSLGVVTVELSDLIALWPQEMTSYLHLNYNFLIYKVGEILVPTSWDCSEG